MRPAICLFSALASKRRLRGVKNESCLSQRPNLLPQSLSARANECTHTTARRPLTLDMHIYAGCTRAHVPERNAHCGQVPSSFAGSFSASCPLNCLSPSPRSLELEHPHSNCAGQQSLSLLVSSRCFVQRTRAALHASHSPASLHLDPWSLALELDLFTSSHVLGHLASHLVPLSLMLFLRSVATCMWFC